MTLYLFRLLCLAVIALGVLLMLGNLLKNKITNIRIGLHITSLVLCLLGVGFGSWSSYITDQLIEAQSMTKDQAHRLPMREALELYHEQNTETPSDTNAGQTVTNTNDNLDKPLSPIIVLYDANDTEKTGINDQLWSIADVQSDLEMLDKNVDSQNLSQTYSITEYPTGLYITKDGSDYYTLPLYRNTPDGPVFYPEMLNELMGYQAEHR